MMKAPTICLVGAGNMGGAILDGWLKADVDPQRISVIDPNPPEAMAKLMEDAGVTALTSADGAAVPDILIVAVKPQIIGKVLDGLGGLMSEDNVLVSIVAGTTVAQLAAPFGNVRVIRTMPNTPSQIGQGMTVCVANDGVSNNQRKQVTDLLQAIGQVAWVDDEKLIDAVTGVSGSGPAYVFHLTEALASAGEKAGLSSELAAQLARATVSGAAALMAQSDLTPTRLRENVTSPNGTTQAALQVLMADDGFPALLERAVAAAAKRSRELAE